MNIQIELSDKDKEDIANRLLHKMITAVAQNETFTSFQEAVKNEANVQAKNYVLAHRFAGVDGIEAAVQEELTKVSEKTVHQMVNETVFKKMDKQLEDLVNESVMKRLRNLQDEINRAIRDYTDEDYAD
jgi:vacuolar-type H+-ATPase subunit E/Vma4